MISNMPIGYDSWKLASPYDDRDVYCSNCGRELFQEAESGLCEKCMRDGELEFNRHKYEAVEEFKKRTKE